MYKVTGSLPEYNLSTSHHRYANFKITLYCPGDTSLPCALVSDFHPPASAAPPFSAANFCILASSSGLKWRMRPWMGQAKASPRAVILISTVTSISLRIMWLLTANCVALDLLGQLLQHVNLPLATLTLLKSLHDLLSPLAALTARRALTARLVSVEVT